MMEVKDCKDLYLSQFTRWEELGTCQCPGWLLPLRKAAIARFAERGFPTTRDEPWRFTNVSPIANTAFFLPTENPSSVTLNERDALCVGERTALLVFVNGCFAPELSTRSALPDGVTVKSLSEAMAGEDLCLEQHLTRYARFQDHAFVALNTALMTDGALIHVSPHVIVDTPIQLLYISTPEKDATATFPRNLIVAEANSQLSIVETFVGFEGARTFTNAVTEMVAGDSAAIDHYKVQREAQEAFHIGMACIHQNDHSRVSSMTVSLGGALVRNEIHVVLDGEGADCTLNGLSMVRGSQHVDNHLCVEHAKPHGSSREYFKNVLDDRARGVFSGRIVVAQDAQKTDAKQTNMTLLLSEEARVESRPQLEIYADDVKCTHGATIGQVDEEAIFYLQSRGVSRSSARSILVYAFARECVSWVRWTPLRTQLESLLTAFLSHGERFREAL